MRYWYRPNDVTVLPDDLVRFAWSAPMRDLAARIGISDVGLKKLLVSHGVTSPPQGYWNKLRAGKVVPVRPVAPPRRPGETGRVRLDVRFAKELPVAAPIGSSGPFASSLVPEDLDALYAQELAAIGRVTVPNTLARVHPGLVAVLKQEQLRAERLAGSASQGDAPLFASTLDRRRLRICNAVLIALSRRRHGGYVVEWDKGLHLTATIGDTYVGASIEALRKQHSRAANPQGRAKATRPRLELRLLGRREGETLRVWRDDNQGALETKIGAIAAGLIEGGEASFRQSLREAEELADQRRREAEKQAEEQLAALSRERLAKLKASGEEMREAANVRALVAQVRHAVSSGGLAVDAAKVERWERWALREADKIDPVSSGRIVSQFDAPPL